jgi:hypothetical protein
MLYIALLHYPVYNKEGKIVTTAIVNADIHDIGRLAKTYAVRKFYIINPIPDQRSLAREIISHWKEGYGASYNKSRQAAFELILLKESLRDVVEDITTETGCAPKTVVTGANFKEKFLEFAKLKEMLRHNKIPFLLIFGTGSGIAAELADVADYRLESIKGHDDYNHLSVRSAAAIILDRINYAELREDT